MVGAARGERAMSWPRASLDRLRRLRVWEYAVRFAFGGAVTVAAGMIGDRFGVAAGGMFLAFPAILPASLTLVARHGGRRDALDDARGGRVGALAMAGFALVVAVTAAAWPGAAVLAAATAAWLIAAVAAWRGLLA
jgi:hypothetical protein